MTRIILLSRLREGIDPAVYEQWVVEVDYPFARGLPAISRYEVSRLDGFLFETAGKLGSNFDYVEVIDVPDLDAYLVGVGTEEGARFLEEWSSYIEDFVVIQGAVVE
jgi:hypothetical protein